ncbi:MAG TPA: alpha/beta hydrolase [Solirubrobacteraceae bacterium]|jgi:pimeloyl-ACP methyl ester carboxylesterase|nr:alpha/beta hydrolase [Solirubrobacteraceae bacterium]
MSHTVTSADGVTIAYERSGSGPALVIVNGALSTKEAGAPLAPLLHEDFTLYRYDRRGRGESSDSGSSTPQNELQDLAAIVAATGEAPLVYGHSSGAALSLEAAVSGVPMRGLVVHEPPYVRGSATTEQTASELAALAADGRRDEAVERFMQGTEMPDTMIEQIKASPAWVATRMGRRSGTGCSPPARSSPASSCRASQRRPRRPAAAVAPGPTARRRPQSPGCG